MSTVDWLVLIGGIAAIVWVNWYFFFADRGSASAVMTASGLQEVKIAVKGGYDPAVVHVKRGAPVRLVFDRQETSGCSEEIVFPDLGVKKFLPPFERTEVVLAPLAPGRYEFTCGMSMLHGALVVE